MYREMLKSKIHRATVTQSNLNYVGSLTLDPDLMEASNILAHERVDVAVITNGARWTTYVLPGPRGSGIVGVNGATSRLALEGDLVIVMAYASLLEEELEEHQPSVVFVDQRNRITKLGTDVAEEIPDSHTLRGDRVYR
jgi:aspartate 1-decarboxylase